ncbi:uncharacterized protein LOC143221313, partial [Lasioglossum baleicum]|uniref:uncharacterized protein LOC143221313 n=1 Tax=Lasioglossum baleicum TaxID=434251 RepID=UPI003FCD8C94
AIHNFLYFLLLNQIMTCGVFSRHVHLKILVPDVINRHTHTRTIFLHLHMPAPKKPKTHKKHEYHSNWSSWKYGHQQDYKDNHGDIELEHENHQKDYGETLTVKSKNRKQHRQKHYPVYDYSKDSYLPPSYVEDNDLDQKNRDQDEYSYAVHEDVNDIPPNTESVSYNYEEGYKKGLETETGHIRADQMHKFHEDQHEEQGETENEGFKEDHKTKTDAGRYLVDDVEYENMRDKRERRRSKRIYKT